MKQHGHAYVPRHHALKNGFRLGPWVVNQRYRYDHGVLSKERQEALESIPTWTWKGRYGIAGSVSKEWTKSLSRLKEYVKREGHANVPSEYKTKNGYWLGAWVGTQRDRRNGHGASNTKLTKE